MKKQVIICKCGRIFHKSGYWLTFKELPHRDKFVLITAYNQCRVEEIVETCNFCKDITLEVSNGVFGL